MKGLLRERRWWLGMVVILLAYALLYDNANSWPSAKGYNWTRLLPVPRQLRVAEIGLIGGLLVLALMNSVSRLTRTLMVGLLVFLGIGLVSYARDADVPLLDGVRLIYMWLMPVCLFIIGREAPWPRTAWKWIAGVLMAWLVLCVLASWAQWGVLEYPVGDDITGLNKDAHANGTLMMFAALGWLSVGMFRKRSAGLAMGALFLVTMVLSSVLKVMFFGGIAVALLVWIHQRSLPAGRAGLVPPALKWAIVGVGAVMLMGYAFSRIDLISANRFSDFEDRVLSSPQNLGPIQAHRVALGSITGQLATLMLGVGPFHLANPISVGQVEGSLSFKAQSDVLAIDDEKGEQARVTLTSSLLAEFGLPAFLVIVAIFVAIYRAVWRTAWHPDPEIRWRGAWIAMSALILWLVPVASLFGSFDVMSVTFPVMLMAGLVCRDAARATYEAGPHDEASA